MINQRYCSKGWMDGYKAINIAHPCGEAGELDQHEDVGRGQVDKREKSLEIRK